MDYFLFFELKLNQYLIVLASLQASNYFSKDLQIVVGFLNVYDVCRVISISSKKLSVRFINSNLKKKIYFFMDK